MSQTKWILRLAALVAVTGACSSEGAKNEKTIVQGTVSQQLKSGGAEAVALGDDGRTFWSALDAKGDFKLEVPAGHSYRIVLAKRGADGKPVAIAQLALTSAAGKTQWVTAKAGAVLRLGDLVPAGTLAATSTGGLKPASGGGGSLESADTSSSDTSSDTSDGSGRGGSGRGGRGGDDAHESDDDGADAFEDDKEHEDDPESHEVESAEGHVCDASSAPEMESSRNSAGDVSESCDFGSHSANDSCEAPPPAGGSSGSAPAGGSSGSAPAGGSSGSAPAESTIQ